MTGAAITQTSRNRTRNADTWSWSAMLLICMTAEPTTARPRSRFGTVCCFGVSFCANETSQLINPRQHQVHEPLDDGQ
jgi:hypothetical protein